MGLLSLQYRLKAFPQCQINTRKIWTGHKPRDLESWFEGHWEEAHADDFKLWLY